MLSHNFQIRSRCPTSSQTLVSALHNHFLSTAIGNVETWVHRNSLSKTKKLGLRRTSTGVKPVFATTKKPTTVKAVVTVLPTVSLLVVELVAAKLPAGGVATIQPDAIKSDDGEKKTYYDYEASFKIPEEFGEVGGVTIENKHDREMFVKSIVLDGFTTGPIHIHCDSWIQPKSVNPDPEKTQKRLFFCNKSYLPEATPEWLKPLREQELEILRGNGQGERQPSDRIYDYDVYNDLGDPDKGEETARPILGGHNHPYPRRCRTGRPRTEKDPLSESRATVPYVPRDEAFSEVKEATFQAKTVYSVLYALASSLTSTITDPDLMRFPYFSAIDALFNEGIMFQEGSPGFRGNKMIKATENSVLRFETPEFVDRDKFAWLSDAEFARQTLAGINPCTIKLVTEWPLKSKLDPKEYGPAESGITKVLVEQEIGGFMTVEEAVKQKRLFILDYHDFLLPFVEKVRQLKGTTLYGSRTLFFLTLGGTLRPLAIELTQPPIDGKPQWKGVFHPCWDATGLWLWRLAKSHVLAHDSGYHQLISHWLRTHCCTEPYIIATHRQLSAMHPIYRLLLPHLRYTMEINALARGTLINANGIIEKAFTPGKYSMELSSAAYNQLWRFDREALPADLINRGMAVEDQTADHGLKLTIEDYPYANDGLLLWDAIKQWVTDYVAHYYPESGLVESDTELQAWWTEIKTVGHGDKKDEPWWPELKTSDDLIGILTTIIWIASGHHSSVNFGQFDFGAYFPNRPTIARVQMPEEPSEEWKEFLERPEVFLLKSFPSQVQATVVMAVLGALSNHSPDEEYIGGEIKPYWACDEVIKAAFERFQGQLKKIEGIIDGRNADSRFKNRSGAGVVPYELLKPYSEPGVTGKGVPNSISI